MGIRSDSGTSRWGWVVGDAPGAEFTQQQGSISSHADPMWGRQGSASHHRYHQKSKQAFTEVFQLLKF